MDPRFGRYLHVLRDKPALIAKESLFYGVLFSIVTPFLHNIITSPVKTKDSNVVSTRERCGVKNGTEYVNTRERRAVKTVPKCKYKGTRGC